MMRKRENCETLFNAARLKDSDINDDGTMTTKHGRHIVPLRAKFKDTDAGGIRTQNLPEFLSQPRVKEIRAQVSEVNYAKGQDVILNKDTGDFYLKDVNESAESVLNKAPLGQIDLDSEKSLFTAALRLHSMQQMMENFESEKSVDTNSKFDKSPSP